MIDARGKGHRPPLQDSEHVGKCRFSDEQIVRLNRWSSMATPKWGSGMDESVISPERWYVSPQRGTQAWVCYASDHFHPIAAQNVSSTRAQSINFSGRVTKIAAQTQQRRARQKKTKTKQRRREKVPFGAAAPQQWTFITFIWIAFSSCGASFEGGAHASSSTSSASWHAPSSTG